MTPSPEQGNVHSLAALACLSADQIRRLRGRWIDSVESLAAMTGSDPGRAGLMQLLEITERQFTQLGESIEALLGSDATARLTRPDPGGRMGVILTEQQKRSLGMPHQPGENGRMDGTSK